MTAFADLHTHTTVTDGRLTPVELVDRAALAGIRYLVITDHSAVTYADVVDHARTRGVQLPFPGVEVSTFMGRRKHHILLYGDALLAPDVQDRLRFPIRWKLEVAAGARDELMRRGHRLPPLEDITAGRGLSERPTPERTFPSRTAIAAHVAAGSTLSQQAAHELVTSVVRDIEGLDAGDPARLARRYLPTLDVIRLAAANGLVASLAHPLWEHDVSALEDLRPMACAGLRGLESRSYHHRAYDDHHALLRVRDELGLVATAGTDFHGNGKTNLGDDGLTEAAFEVVARMVEQARRTVPER